MRSENGKWHALPVLLAVLAGGVAAPQQTAEASSSQVAELTPFDACGVVGAVVLITTFPTTIEHAVCDLTGAVITKGRLSVDVPPPGEGVTAYAMSAEGTPGADGQFAVEVLTDTLDVLVKQPVCGPRWWWTESRHLISCSRRCGAAPSSLAPSCTP